MESPNSGSASYAPPLTLTLVSWASIGIAALASLWITWDIVYRRRWKHMMAIMIPVYIINALYLWPITVWTYIQYGRREMSMESNDEAEAIEEAPLLHTPPQPDHGAETAAGEQHLDGSSMALDHHDAGGDVGAGDHHDPGTVHGEEAHQHPKHPHHSHMHADLPMFATVTIATCHCGAGCVLGDIVGEWLIYKFGVMVAGKMLYAAFVVDFAFALAFGIVFQYFSIAPMAGDYGWRTIVRAAKADFLSLTFFEIGLFGWMAIFDLLIFDQKLGMNTAAYWFMMQVGMFFRTLDWISYQLVADQRRNQRALCLIETPGCRRETPGDIDLGRGVELIVAVNFGSRAVGEDVSIPNTAPQKIHVA